VKVEDGFPLWSETYDRELTDVFAVQDDIARSVSNALKVTLLGEHKSPSTVPESRGAAHNLYLQGQYFRARRTKGDLEKSIGYYEQALQLDPSYARIQVGLAGAYVTQADRGHVPVGEGYAKARQAVEAALTLDPNLAEAYAALGWIRRSYDWDWSGADAAQQRALDLEPGNVVVVRGAGALAATLGRFAEAIALGERAVELDPLNVGNQVTLGFFALRAGRLEVAEKAFRKALEFDAEFPDAHHYLGQVYLVRSDPVAALREMELEKDPFWRRFGLALAYHALGRKKEADAALAELLEKHGDEAAVQIAGLYAYRGESAAAFTWLDRAYAQRDAGLSQIKGDALLRGLEADPRYKTFLEKMRLPY
jgi:tetratricopeptide (TPR) repeat protein